MSEARDGEPDLEVDDTTAQPPPMTKSAMKKAARRERIAAQRGEKRAREKEVRKAKKREREERRAAGELEEDDLPKAKRRRVGPPFGGRVVIDLGFDNSMTEKEVLSLTSQLAYSYSANRNSGYQFRLLFTHLDGKTLTRLESVGDAAHSRWKNAEWWTEDYDKLWEADPNVKSSVVYLTADSEEELTELKPEETYIIGGICDHNRLKNATLDKAQKGGVRTARLPIGRYLAEMKTRKVLTVNQTFEILVNWVDSRDWETAFHTVIPKRKFEENGKKHKSKNNTEDNAVADPTEQEGVNEGGEASKCPCRRGNTTEKAKTQTMNRSMNNVFKR
ncbi:SAM-dependent MTase TRM10-type domain-containing protein [Mycena indigotica]|uniref:tRNA (guanine(9)-N1)-methyltransferase n=1 Tax=Mycena indigotica TaxID=2126181 RepID=A0A8H6SPR3_9AGAR|nr:SAM-dependent MTase TRM10-type domain-containing protein [Mycena indigotica]KAF7302127.1 SAM-dependent MTase TRM10-type domain-containing protein [Mycena indigotica]